MNQRKRTNSSGLHLNHPAFTLVELLVVIAMIGILIALLLPPVQAVSWSNDFRLKRSARTY